MAVLTADVAFDLMPLFRIQKAFPEFNGRLLSLVGKRSRILLKEDYLSGQEIELRKFPTDKRGRYTVSSDVNRRRTQVKIYSYPVNLFERGRILRSGQKEPGKYIVTRKLKQAVMSRLASYVLESEREIIKPVIKDLEVR